MKVHMTIKREKWQFADDVESMTPDTLLRLFDAVGLAAFIYRKGAWIRCNTRAVTLFRTPKQELLAMGPFSYAPVPQTIVRALEQDAGSTTEFPANFLSTFERRDGTMFEKEVILRHVTWHGETNIVIILKETLTDRPCHLAGPADMEKFKMAQRIGQLHVALKAVVENREIEKQAIETHLLNNFKKYIFPYFDKMANCRHSSVCRSNYQTIQDNLAHLQHTSDDPCSRIRHKLNANEVKIADLIRQGKSNKEIAEVLHLAPRSVCWYRNRIRHKLGLVGAKINLREFLLKKQTAAASTS